MNNSRVDPVLDAHYDAFVANGLTANSAYGLMVREPGAAGLKNAGKDLTLDSFIKGMESIKDYHDIFNGPEVNFGPDKHQGASSSFFLALDRDLFLHGKGGSIMRIVRCMRGLTAGMLVLLLAASAALKLAMSAAMAL